MSRIDELVRDLCPDGVPFKALGEVGEFIRGNGLQKSDLTDHGVPAIHYGQIHTSYGTWTASTKSFTLPELAARLRRARPGDLIIATTSEDDAAVAKATAWLGMDEVAVSSDAFIYRHGLEPRFVSYFFQSAAFQEQKARHITGTKVRRISAEALARLRIPVPPDSVQYRIASALDEFSELEAQLEAELDARRRQYAFYRDQLLTFREAGGGRGVALSRLADLKYGFTASGRAIGDYRLLRITDITSQGALASDNIAYVDATTASARYLLRPGDLLMARTGATFGKTMLFSASQSSVFASFLIRIRFPRGNVLPGFYWHFAQTTGYWAQANALVGRAGQPQFNGNALSRLVMPVPPLDEQRRIAGILDKFDALVNDLSSGLPAELAARRKQYAYYRDKLLTFREAA